MAVQRQTAASRSASPSMREQQGVFGGVPTTTLTKPLSTSAQTPSFRVSLGQVGLVAGVGGDGGFGEGVGALGALGTLGVGTLGALGALGVGVHEPHEDGGFGGGGHGTWLEVTRVKKRRLRERRRVVDEIAFEAISCSN